MAFQKIKNHGRGPKAVDVRVYARDTNVELRFSAAFAAEHRIEQGSRIEVFAGSGDDAGKLLLKPADKHCAEAFVVSPVHGSKSLNIRVGRGYLPIFAERFKPTPLDFSPSDDGVVVTLPKHVLKDAKFEVVA